MRIPQARILEWVAVSSSRGSSQSKDRTQVSPHYGQILYHLSTRETQLGEGTQRQGSEGKRFLATFREAPQVVLQVEEEEEAG